MDDGDDQEGEQQPGGDALEGLAEADWVCRAANRSRGSRRMGPSHLGRRADLVLLSANPLENINNTKKIEGVMVRGQWLTDDAIQKRLDQLAKEYAR